MTTGTLLFYPFIHFSLLLLHCTVLTRVVIQMQLVYCTGVYHIEPNGLV